MKTNIQIVTLAALTATITLAGCATPATRHDSRVDRRYDAAERAGDGTVGRQDNRYDRRGDRQERVENRY
jgi:hypothetical protein